MNPLPGNPNPDESQQPQQQQGPMVPQQSPMPPAGYPQHPQLPGVQAPISGVQMNVSAQTRSNGTAVTAMIIGIALLVFGLPSACFAGTPLGLVLLMIVGLGSIAPIVLGAVALKRIPYTQEGGKGMAIAGIVAGVVAGVWVMFVMLAWIYIVSSSDSDFFYTLMSHV